MSNLASVRTRLPRIPALTAAGARAGLVLVPTRASSARRTPFVVLVLGVLAAGMVGLLLFNTHMQQKSFQITALQDRADALVAQQQSLSLQVSRLRDPQRVAEKARSLGMVDPPAPAFVQVPGGKVLGKPTPATVADAVHVRPFPATRPGRLSPPPKIVKVPARGASADPGATEGRNALEGSAHRASQESKHGAAH